MGQNSAIEWTHHTFNPWRGCAKVSPGCAHCYAEVQSKRNPKTLGVWGANGTRPVAAESYWRQPLAWDKAAEAAGERHRVFCASLADVFEDRPELHVPRFRLMHLIRLTPHLDWLLLTKRPAGMLELIAQCGRVVPGRCEQYDETLFWLSDWVTGKPPKNVWAGITAENQRCLEERRGHLEHFPAAIRFISYEPALGPLDLLKASVAYVDPGHCESDRGISSRLDWLICGGESGGNARPMHPEWARSIRDQCQAAGVAFFFKQWGEWGPLDQVPGLFERRTSPSVGPRLRWPWGIDGPGVAGVVQMGKKAAGRLLDGREWNEMPKAAGEKVTP
jgi:protein gp37